VGVANPDAGGHLMGSRSARRGRLSRSAEFERVYRHGSSIANRHLVLYTFPNPGVERPRLGLSVSRKVGGAVRRNKVKRLLREAFAQAEEGLKVGQDVVVVARPPAGELAEREGLAGVDAALAELITKAGLRAAAASGVEGGDERTQ
jgi:ribonuclease P protein component